MPFEAVAKSYDELHAALRRRAEDLKLSRETIDDLAGLSARYSGKVLGLGKVRGLGRISLGPILAALGLRIVLIEDDEAMQRIAERRLPARDESRVRHPGARREAAGVNGIRFDRPAD